ncbi:ATP-dependent Clp protease ATP-binding subunit, partial [Acidithiobacillus caldus ATCC 51756]|nr:ATP-dependent Clp protease ATP-binding subunit [Acidithiobacillus caldus ATCC 51756]
KYQRSIAVNIAVQTKLLMLDLSPIALGYITDQVTGSRFGVRHVDQVLSREIVDRVIDMGDALPTDRKCWYVWDYRDGKLELINVHKQGIAFLREQRGEDHQTTNDYLLRLSKQLIARAREVQNATPRSVAAKTPQPVGGKPAEPSRYIVR